MKPATMRVFAPHPCAVAPSCAGDGVPEHVRKSVALCCPEGGADNDREHREDEAAALPPAAGAGVASRGGVLEQADESGGSDNEAGDDDCVNNSDNEEEEEEEEEEDGQSSQPTEGCSVPARTPRSRTSERQMLALALKRSQEEGDDDEDGTNAHLSTRKSGDASPATKPNQLSRRLSSASSSSSMLPRGFRSWSTVRKRLFQLTVVDPAPYLTRFPPPPNEPIVGEFTPSEDQLLREAVSMSRKGDASGQVNWGAVASHVGTRAGYQCRNRAFSLAIVDAPAIPVPPKPTVASKPRAAAAAASPSRKKTVRSKPRAAAAPESGPSPPVPVDQGPATPQRARKPEPQPQSPAKPVESERVGASPVVAKAQPRSERRRRRQPNAEAKQSPAPPKEEAPKPADRGLQQETLERLPAPAARTSTKRPAGVAFEGRTSVWSLKKRRVGGEGRAVVEDPPPSSQPCTPPLPTSVPDLSDHHTLLLRTYKRKAQGRTSPKPLAEEMCPSFYVAKQRERVVAPNVSLGMAPLLQASDWDEFMDVARAQVLSARSEFDLEFERWHDMFQHSFNLLCERKLPPKRWNQAKRELLRGFASSLKDVRGVHAVRSTALYKQHEMVGRELRPSLLPSDLPQALQLPLFVLKVET